VFLTRDSSVRSLEKNENIFLIFRDTEKKNHCYLIKSFLFDVKNENFLKNDRKHTESKMIFAMPS